MNHTLAIVVLMCTEKEVKEENVEAVMAGEKKANLACRFSKWSLRLAVLRFTAIMSH